MNTVLKKYIQLYKQMQFNDQKMIPLCAAQTYISDFCKKPLISNFEGKYSFIEKDGKNSFVDGNYVVQLNNLLSEECRNLFQTSYANADTLTGINCFTVCAMSLLKNNNRVLVTTPEQGGHPSIPVILDTLNIKYESMPYDYSKYQIDYEKINDLLDKTHYDYLIFCQSDLINPPNLSKLKLSKETGIIYDGTQTLGLIASKIIENPLKLNNVVLLGGAHKTLPAPACGLIMTNNNIYKDILKEKITPHYLRNTQPNHIASLLLSLIEQEKFGKLYQSKTIELANILGKKLEKLGFNIAKISSKRYTYTHQIFILMSEKDTNDFFYRAQKYNISLNKKHKKLFNYNGIRLGTQQIARYNWNNEEIQVLSRLLYLIFLGEQYEKEIIQLREWLIQRKIPHFKYEEIAIE